MRNGPASENTLSRPHWTLPGPLTSRDLLIILGFALLAFLGNYFPIPLMFGVDVLVGGILVYILLLQYGLVIALLAGLPSFFATALIWSHPWAGVALTAELLVLGYLVHRFQDRQLPLLLAAIWVPVGALLIFAVYHFRLELPTVDAGVVALKQAINSIANATLAVVLNYLVVSRWLPDRRRLVSLSEALFYVPATLVVMVVVLILFTISQVQLRSLEATLFDRVEESRESFLNQNNLTLRRLERDVALLNTQCLQSSGSNLLDTDCVKQRLPLSEWDSLHFLPETGAAEGVMIRGIGVQPLAESPYQWTFAEWLDTEDLNYRYLVSEPSVLHYFRPVTIGDTAGFLVASMDIALSAGRFWRAPSDAMQRQSWLVDGHKVVRSESDLFDNLDPATDYAPVAAGEIGYAQPDIPGMNKVNLWARSAYYTEVEMINAGSPLPGTLRFEVSPRSQQESTFAMYIVILSLALLFILISLLVSHRVTLWLLRPMKSLVHLSRRIPMQIETSPDTWQWPESLPLRELEDLHQGLHKMSGLLHQQQQRDRQLSQVLEHEVVARTQDLEAAQQHIQSILNYMEGALWSGQVEDGYLHLTLVSPSVQSLTGFSAETWLQKSTEMYGRIRESHRGRAAAELRHMTRQDNGEFELEFQHADGQWRFLRVSYWAVYGRNGEILRVDGMTTDITDWHKAQEKLKAQEELLAHQARRAAMGEMISNIAHQWRQPLNSLRLVQANLRDAHVYGELTDDVLLESLDKADDLIDRMNQTVRDFLTFFRPAKEPEVFNLSGLIADAVRIMEGTFTDYPVTIDTETEPIVQVYGFANEILQILLVILQNARETIEERRVADGRVIIRLNRHEGEAKVTIADNAGGVPEDIISLIFDPYFTTRAEGTGIGLYMAKRLIEGQMQGAIDVINAEAGAEFQVFLPLADTADA